MYTCSQHVDECAGFGFHTISLYIELCRRSTHPDTQAMRIGGRKTKDGRQQVAVYRRPSSVEIRIGYMGGCIWFHAAPIGSISRARPMWQTSQDRSFERRP